MELIVNLGRPVNCIKGDQVTWNGRVQGHYIVPTTPSLQKELMFKFYPQFAPDVVDISIIRLIRYRVRLASGLVDFGGMLNIIRRSLYGGISTV